MDHEKMKLLLIEQGMTATEPNLIKCPKCERFIGPQGFKRHLRWHEKMQPRVEEAIRLYFTEKNTQAEVCRKLGTNHKWLKKIFEDNSYHLRTPSEVMKVSYEKGRISFTPSGEKAPHWRGGRRLQGGYIMIRIPNPAPMHRGRQPYICVLEHHYIWEKTHNRKLPEGWVIHHLNGIKTDNRPENLAAMPKEEHTPGLHTQLESYKLRIRELELKVELLQRIIDNQAQEPLRGEN